MVAPWVAVVRRVQPETTGESLADVGDRRMRWQADGPRRFLSTSGAPKDGDIQTEIRRPENAVGGRGAPCAAGDHRRVPGDPGPPGASWRPSGAWGRRPDESAARDATEPRGRAKQGGYYGEYGIMVSPWVAVGRRV